MSPLNAPFPSLFTRSSIRQPLLPTPRIPKLMPLTPTVLFDLPQREISLLITDRMTKASAFSIVTGFATPGGLAAILAPIKAKPQNLQTLIVGAATYPGFQ